MSDSSEAVASYGRSNGKLPLPEYGVLYFHHLNAELRSLPAGKIDPEIKIVTDEIVKKSEAGALCWDDLYTFDLVISRLLPSERLPRLVWNLRLRYRSVVDLPEYEAYLASKPPNLNEEAKETDLVLRADIEYLLGQIYLRYSITPVAEEIRDRISKRVASVILVGLAVIAAVFSLTVFGISQPYSASLPTAIFAGAMGGLLSLQQRYQSASRDGDPIDSISQLMHNWPKVFLPAINGAIFAFVLYMLVRAGLLAGDVFPKFSSEDNKNGLVLLDFLRQGRPEAASDYAKLIVWSFIAGFAERFVPDTLSRFINKRETESKRST
jgi:hypothetical protein